jgi:hypothetical protein
LRLSDGEKMFKLFRLGGDQGYGWTRDQLAAQHPGRLRVFAQNAKWALENQGRVEAMLATGETEATLRKAVQEAVAASKEGRQEETEEPWENVTLRLNQGQARFLRGVLAGMQVKREQVHGETFSAKASVALGQAVFAMAGEWYAADEAYDDGEGGEVRVANASFMDPGLVAEIDALSAAEQLQQAAD